MVKGWQKNCIILQKSTHSKAYFVSPSILYAHFGKENINGIQKKAVSLRFATDLSLRIRTQFDPVFCFVSV